ncbi:MAG TPA: extracellular solute-binding protein [Chloroflexota bacterium]|nr:extracellular solute-binding protein [Chloroflexota bacterium]
MRVGVASGDGVRGVCGVGRRRLLRGAIVGFGGAAAAAAMGCAGPGSPVEKPATTAEPVVAKVLLMANPVFTAVQAELTTAQAEIDPNLQLDMSVFPGQIALFREKLVTIYAGGDVPDVQWVHPSVVSLFGSKKLLRPLDDYARKDRDTALSDFYPGVLDYFQWRDVTYGLPWYSPGWVFVFNKELFDRKGVATPDRQEREGKWNWEGFVSTLRSLTSGNQGAPDRTIGSMSHSMALDWACSWIWRNGGDVFSKDAKKCVINEPAAVEAIEGMADLHTRYQVINYGQHMQDFSDGFFSGRVGLRQANKETTAPGENDLVKATFPLGMAPVYKGKGGRVNRMGPLGFGVARDAPSGDAGWRLVRFMAGPRAAGILMNHQSTLPIRPRFAQLPEFGKSMLPWENKDVWLESQSTARSLSQPASYNDVAALWMTTWNDILAQKGTVKSALDDFTRQVNGMLALEQ